MIDNRNAMKRVSLNVMFLLYFAYLGCMAAAPALEVGARGDDRELQRIEFAFMAGLGKAVTPLETYECLRFRNAALVSLLERTYASTLAWLTDRQDMADTLEKDQARWFSELTAADAIWGVSMSGKIASQATVSTMILERLRLFDAIAGGRAFKESAN